MSKDKKSALLAGAILLVLSAGQAKAGQYTVVTGGAGTPLSSGNIVVSLDGANGSQIAYPEDNTWGPSNGYVSWSWQWQPSTPGEQPPPVYTNYTVQLSGGPATATHKGYASAKAEDILSWSALDVYGEAECVAAVDMYTPKKTITASLPASPTGKGMSATSRGLAPTAIAQVTASAQSSGEVWTSGDIAQAETGSIFIQSGSITFTTQ